MSPVIVMVHGVGLDFGSPSRRHFWVLAAREP
jgi:hypothetical protein